MIGLLIIAIMLGLYVLYEIQPVIRNSKYDVCLCYDEDCESMTPIQHWTCFTIDTQVSACAMLPHTDMLRPYRHNTEFMEHLKSFTTDQFIEKFTAQHSPFRERDIIFSKLLDKTCRWDHHADAISYGLGVNELTEEGKCKNIPVRNIYK